MQNTISIPVRHDMLEWLSGFRPEHKTQVVADEFAAFIVIVDFGLHYDHSVVATRVANMRSETNQTTDGYWTNEVNVIDADDIYSNLSSTTLCCCFAHCPEELARLIGQLRRLPHQLPTKNLPSGVLILRMRHIDIPQSCASYRDESVSMVSSWCRRCSIEHVPCMRLVYEEAALILVMDILHLLVVWDQLCQAGCLVLGPLLLQMLTKSGRLFITPGFHKHRVDLQRLALL
mmetsp:Transcript_112369/g.223282  ORF Transcript_112369/g.223282 Transcript_112369/m.223282 type:complete len:232 (+) Transcript_112369:167-862(+)